MPCEFIGTKACPVSEGISALRQSLGKAAEGSPVKELREVVCQDTNNGFRKETCPIYKSRGGKS